MSQSPVNNGVIASARDISVSFGRDKVLDVPDIQVYRNEVLVIIGPNGSGKTTLLLCLTRLANPQTGTVSYEGIPVLDSKAVLHLHRKLAVVFQESLLLNSSVWDNVMLGLRLRSIKGDEAKTRTQKWLERFGMAHMAKRQARTLSSGEAKRVSLARAFALQPEILFLDEPFTALDSPTRQALLEDFENVLNETRITTVMVTHDRNEAIQFFRRNLTGVRPGPYPGGFTIKCPGNNVIIDPENMLHADAQAFSRELFPFPWRGAGKHFPFKELRTNILIVFTHVHLPFSGLSFHVTLYTRPYQVLIYAMAGPGFLEWRIEGVSSCTNPAPPDKNWKYPPCLTSTIKL